MKKILSLFFIFLAFLGQAQILTPVKWKTSIEKVSDSEVVLIFDATIEKDWHMFSQHSPEGGSLPTVFEFKNQDNYKLVGETTESPYKKVYSDIFEVDEYMFEDTAQFKQTVQISKSDLKNIEVYVEYQVCKEACIQQDETFVFNISDLNLTSVSDSAHEDTKPVVEDDFSLNSLDANKVDDLSIVSIFLISFVSGFAALLTPCVFPMIPMTVSFFTKQSKTRAKGIKNAIFYGISIIIIYVVLGLIVTAIFGADALNALSTNVWFNIIFFLILVFFATSFLGAFEIMLPNSWANKVDKQADRGGVIGILFMALALAIVSFSCTGPIVGTLLVQAASKGGIAPLVGMFGFSLALALPFMLFAMFPGWLNTLPKSGVKFCKSISRIFRVSFGF